MVDLWDAVGWRSLLGKSGLKVGYADGPVSAWPPDAFATLTEVIPYRITVLADPRWELFDHEAGNAGPAQIANAVEARLRQGLWSVCYTNGAELITLEAALRSLGISWAPADAWPALGVYLWAAAPGTPPGRIPGWCPVPPVAVQDRWEKDWDISSCYAAFPSGGARPGLAPPARSSSDRPAPGFHPGDQPPTAVEDDMVIVRAPSGAAATFDGTHKHGIPNAADLKALTDAGVTVANVSQQYYDHIPNI